MKRPGLLVVLGLLLGVGAAMTLFWRAPTTGRPVIINDTAVPPLPTLNPEHVDEGAAIYAQHCASCHGANLEGQPNWKERLPDGSLPPPPHDSSGHTWHHSDAVLLSIITNGGDPAYNSKMPAFGDRLSQDEMMSLLEFFKSRWGREEREFQWWMTATGSDLGLIEPGE